jgi:hypothetical protein
MATETKKHAIFQREQDLLDFARSYLSEAFPNPERNGCPPDDAIRLLASQPMRRAESVIDHLTSCSRCFSGYMAHLARLRDDELELQRTLRKAWIKRSLLAAGVALMLIMAIHGVFTNRQSRHTDAPSAVKHISEPPTPAQRTATAMYIPILIDLSNASPVRGIQRQGANPSPQIIPSNSLIDLTLHLPLGSDDQTYLVRLWNKRVLIWSQAAQAQIENDQASLHMHTDFSHVPAGNYDLVVTAKGFLLSVPIQVKSGSSGGIR